MRFFKKTVIPLLNTHRSYTGKMKVFSRFLNIVMESALWIFRGSSFHNLAAEVPKRRFPNRMDLFLYGTSDKHLGSFISCDIYDRNIIPCVIFIKEVMDK